MNPVISASLPSEITLIPGTANGTPLTGWIQGERYTVFTCNVNDDDGFNGYNASEQVYFADTGRRHQEFIVRETGHPSIGVIVRAEGGVQEADNPGSQWPFPFATQWMPNSWYGGSPDVFVLGLQVMLIKIGDIEPGVLSPFAIGRMYAHPHNQPGGEAYGEVTLMTTGSTVLSTGTCTPTIPNKSVNLDIATFDNLLNVGDTASETPFNIELLCSGTNNAGINVRFDGIVDADALDGSVIASTGTSDGVGIQIKHNGSPMQLSENVRVINGAVGDFVTASFTASYYRVNRDLVAGSVNSVATYTVTYP
ncbi:hypothetical protein JCM19233_1980 [Vibrio astriarenae]|nr:hypothetical protein JCM19233_1980 [Vibrio sp. C7]